MHDIWQKIHCHFDFMAVFSWFIQEPNNQKSGTEKLHTRSINMCFLDLIYSKMMNV